MIKVGLWLQNDHKSALIKPDDARNPARSLTFGTRRSSTW